MFNSNRKLLCILALLVTCPLSLVTALRGQAVIVASSGDCAGGQPPVYNATTKLYDCQTISTGGTGTLQNGLASGGSVAYTGSGLTFTVQAASYVIAGVAYTSPQTNVTLDAASGANDRIDAIIVDNTGVATKITGTPAGPPLNPSVDPTSQLGLTFVYVPQSSATPANITTDNIYLENTEWTCAAGAGWNCASTTNPYAGTKDIEATTVAAGTTVTLTNGSPVNLGNYNVLIFYIRSKATWGNNRSLTLQFLSGSTPVGSGVTLKNGTFGFSSSTTASYQQIAIPLQQFAATSTVTVLKVTSSGSGGAAPGFYLDNIFLQGGLPQPALPSGLMIWKGTYSATATYNINDVVTSGGATFLALTVNTAITPVAGVNWAVVGSSGLPLNSVSLTGQTTSIGATSVFTPSVSGVYQACTSQQITTSGTGGNLHTDIIYKDINGTATTDTAVNDISLEVQGNHQGFCYTFYAQSGTAIQYQTTVTGATGSPQYALQIRVLSE